MYVNSAIDFTFTLVSCATSDRLSLTPWQQHYVHVWSNLVWTMLNSILYRTSVSNINKLQCAQNSLACTVLRAHHDLSSQARLGALHWLAAYQRIVFKVNRSCVLNYKTLHSQQTAYLHCLLHSYQPSRTLRSANQNPLQTPLLNTNFSQRSFTYVSAETWNNLPDTAKSSPSFTTLNTRLKCHLFKSLTWSINTRYDCVLSISWLPLPQLWFFQPRMYYKFSYYYYYFCFFLYSQQYRCRRLKTS